MPISESDTGAKLIDPALHACDWKEDVIEAKGKEVAEALAKLRNVK
jgi:hypothetical protein